MKKYEDEFGREWDHIEDYIEELKQGCDEKIDEDDEDSDYCGRGGLCEFCQNALNKAEEDQKIIIDEKIDNQINARQEFINKCEEMGFENLLEIRNQLKTNFLHDGRLSQKIMEEYNEEAKELYLTEEEVYEIVELLDISTSRHSDTNYDELLSNGMSRDIARLAI